MFTSVYKITKEIKNNFSLRICCFVIVLLSLGIFSAKAEEFEINKEHSKIEFKIEFMNVSEVVGRFTDYAGGFLFNEKNLSIQDAHLKIFTKSIDTGDLKRDRHLIGHDFFSVGNFPEISFTSSEILQMRLNQERVVNGRLKIKKTEKKIPLKVVFKGVKIDPWGKKNLFLKIKANLKRSDYNMNWNKYLDDGSLLLSDNVEISIDVQAQVKGQKTAFSKFMMPSNKALIERELHMKGKLNKITTPTGSQLK